MMIIKYSTAICSEYHLHFRGNKYEKNKIKEIKNTLKAECMHCSLLHNNTSFLMLLLFDVLFYYYFFE